MIKVAIKKLKLIGLSLKEPTTNQDGKSGIDCGQLWQKFETGDYAEKIPNKLSPEIVAVYHRYQGDHAQPFSYFIGCKVDPETEVPAGLESMFLAEGDYLKFGAKGIMPDCMTQTWEEIWRSNLPRTFKTDFEVYDERSKDWSNAEVDVFVSV